jgi:hypothetical protein
MEKGVRFTSECEMMRLMSDGDAKVMLCSSGMIPLHPLGMIPMFRCVAVDEGTGGLVK